MEEEQSSGKSQSETEHDGSEDRDRYDAHIYDLNLHRGDDPLPPESDCTPMDHAGRPAFVFAIGPTDEDVRKAKVCTACGMATEEIAFDATALTLEAPGGAVDRVTSTRGREETITVPLDDVLDDGDVDRELIHAGVRDDELCLKYLVEEDDDAR